MRELLDWVFKNLLKTPLTIQFKEGGRSELRASYRGYPTHIGERCVGCGICIYVCPSGAIRMEDTDTGKLFIINKCKCTACKECADACPFGAMEFINRPVGTATSKEEYQEITEVNFIRCKKCEKLMPDPKILIKRLIKKDPEKLPPYLEICPNCRRSP